MPYPSVKFLLGVGPSGFSPKPFVFNAYLSIVLMSLYSTSNVPMLTTLLLVHSSHMDAKSIFTCECFLTMAAIVTKMPREMGAFNMIPHIGSISGLLPALRTLVVPLPILKH